jgi:hypothetical protein
MDGSTITNTDMIQAVREAALLADVTISVWSGERSDRKLMDQLKQQNGATGNVGRVVKNMLAGADSKLEAVRSAYNALRTKHYAITLPWVSDPHAARQRGPRLLPHLLFSNYLGELGMLKRAAEALLDDFLAEYPSLIVQARANLGGMADTNYPSVDEVRAAFRIHIDFEPIPAGTNFKGLPEHVIERLSVNMQARQQRMVNQATEAMWGEAKERIGHIVERLSDPEKTFKESTVEQVRELVTLLPGWNVAGSPQVAEVVQDIKTMLDGVTTKEIRKSGTVRQDVASQAKAVADKLAGWGL